MNNIDCAYIRLILDEGKFELTSAYERGLFNASQFYKNFKQLSEKFAESGLEYGAEKLKELFEITAASRFESKWQTDDAVMKIAEIWNYIDVCTDRLNFYEILDELNKDVD